MELVDVAQNSEDGMTLGQRLAAIREKKGIVLEKAAHDTRIRAQRLRELEADDYSKCPHPSYARMFLMDYAKYLGVPQAEIRDALPESGDCGAGGYNYLDRLSDDETAQVPVPMMRRERPRRRVLPALAVLAVVLVLGAGALYVDQKKRQFEALGLGKPSQQQDAVAKPSPAEAPTEAPAPAPVPAKLVAEDVAVLNETIPQAPGEDAAPVPAKLVAEDVAVLNETIPQTPAEDFASVPATLLTPAPAATPDGRAAFFVGGTPDPNALNSNTLDSSGRVQ